MKFTLGLLSGITITVILVIAYQALATEMTASVPQSEMRTCIERCGYKF